MKKKILILGAGWYGCHAAMILLRHNIDFKIYDITNGFFNKSSSKNQNRLHLGFHYSRSAKTRRECLIGFDKFMKTYGFLTVEIPKNYYIVDNKSLLDYETYCNIYTYEHVSYNKVEPDLEFDFIKDKYEGAIKVDERFINFRKTKSYFEKILAPYLIYYNNDNDEDYDYIFNCTYSKLEDMYYEDCISLIYQYKGTDLFATTLMDGKFFSIYPYDIEKGLYTLTDVEHTPFKEIDDIDSKIIKMEAKVKQYIPDFDDWFVYKDHMISRKTKSNNNSDDRSFLCSSTDDREYIMTGGKITGIFAMEDFIINEILPKLL